MTFCEHLVYLEFRRNLFIILAKYLEKQCIADLLFFFFLRVLYLLSSRVLKQFHEMRLVGYCVMFQIPVPGLPGAASGLQTTMVLMLLCLLLLALLSGSMLF